MSNFEQIPGGSRLDHPSTRKLVAVGEGTAPYRPAICAVVLRSQCCSRFRGKDQRESLKILNGKLPLEFYEARNALRIAQSEGAGERYASDSHHHAVQLMNHADGYASEKSVPKKQLIAVAIKAVQIAEDARAIAVKTMDE